MKINDQEYELLRDYLQSVCGIEVGPDKRYLFSTRLGATLRDLRCSSFAQFYARLQVDTGTMQRELVEAMTIHETGFFRDEHPFCTLHQEILPSLTDRRHAAAKYARPRLRIWCAGCSTGQEAYSVAMCVRSWLEEQKLYQLQDVSILGVDVSASAIRHARRGIYQRSNIDHVPSRYLRYVSLRDEQMVVADEIRSMVAFTQLNLAEPFAHIGSFDLILCRNVMIYFSADLKRQIVAGFSRMLNPGGLLMLGVSEGLYTLSDCFEARARGKTSYYALIDQAK